MAGRNDQGVSVKDGSAQWITYLVYSRRLIPILFVLLLFNNVGFTQVTASLSPSSLTVSTPTEITLTIESADMIPENTMVKIWVPGGFKDIWWWVIDNVDASTTGPSSADVTDVLYAETESSPIWENDVLPYVISVRIRNAPLLPYEQLKVKLGDDFNKIRTPQTAGPTEFKVALIESNGQWTEVARATFESIGHTSSIMNIYLPSVMRTGDTALLKISLMEFLVNPSIHFEGALSLACSDPEAQFDDLVSFSGTNSGYMEVPVVFENEGFYRMTATVVSSGPGASLAINSTAESNYVRVQNDPKHYIYWGDLHSHSGWSRDGTGTNSFEYAEFTACLDFFSSAEHINGNGNDTLGISDEEWESIKSKITSRHQPGKFVPITAYESSYYADQGGHHITYFEHEDNAIDLIPRYTMWDHNTIFSLWDQFALLPPEIRVLSWPHFTGSVFYNNSNGAGWDFSDLSINQGERPRLVGAEYINPFRTSFEVYSQHGQSEYVDEDHPLSRENSFWGAQDALAMGEKLGFVAFTDSHLAKAGVSGDGLGAIMAPALERSELFRAIRNRHTYGSTGERIILDFTINDTLMGGEVGLRDNEVPQMELLVYGTDELDRVEIVKWDFNFGTYGDDYHPDFQTIRTFNISNGADHLEESYEDLSFYGDAVYYLRAIQKNEVNDIPVWAWSSPIWVDNLDLDTTIVSGLHNPLLLPIQVFPNPLVGPSYLKVRISLKEPVATTFRLFDAQGRTAVTLKQDLPAGPTELDLDVPDLPTGMYWLHASGGRGLPMGRTAVVIH